MGFSALFWTLRMIWCRRTTKMRTRGTSMVNCYRTFLDYVSLLHFAAVFGRMSYLGGSDSWARAAPLLELGLAISLLVATRDPGLQMLWVLVTLYLPICTLIWFLTFFRDDDKGHLVFWAFEDETKSLILNFNSVITLLLILLSIWVAEVGFEFLLLQEKKQKWEWEWDLEKKQKMKEWRLRNIGSGKKVDKQKMVQTTINWTEKKPLDKSENKSYMTQSP